MAQKEDHDSTKEGSLEGLSLVVGLGATGYSCARFLSSVGASFAVVDSRAAPPLLPEFQREFPDVAVGLGEFSLDAFGSAERLIVSPGVSLRTPAIAQWLERGGEVMGDIALFAQRVAAPVVAVTGSNGKSTVVALLAAILKADGRSFALGGNLEGENFKPALDLLAEDRRELYVLELSSFQLETTRALNAEAVALLNLSPDHMDRYEDESAYLSAKQMIFTGAACVAINEDDTHSWPLEPAERVIRYTPSRESAEGFGVEEIGAEAAATKESGAQNRRWLCWQRRPFFALDEMRLVGDHNVSNALAAASLAVAVDVSLEAIAAGLRECVGLPHRCQWVARHQGVDFYNDSKGTNVGAALASIEGIGRRLSAKDGRVVLIAGGEGKGADFTPLAKAVDQYVRTLVLIGEAAERIAAVVAEGGAQCEVVFALDLPAAVNAAASAARPDDAVLLAPACASFDMFDNFQHRGDSFVGCVTARNEVTGEKP